MFHCLWFAGFVSDREDNYVPRSNGVCVPVSESAHPLEVLFEEEEEETGLGAATALCQVSQVTPSLSCRGTREGGGGRRRRKRVTYTTEQCLLLPPHSELLLYHPVPAYRDHMTGT